MGITITSATDTAREEFKVLLAAAQMGVTNTSLDSWFKKRMTFTGIEIYNNTELKPSCDRDGHRHGMRFFVSGECTLHIIHALCGYNGTGVILSGQILELLGISGNTLEYDLERGREIRFEQLAAGGWTWKIVKETDAENRRQAERRYEPFCSLKPL